jgi:hypothetical protein
VGAQTARCFSSPAHSRTPQLLQGAAVAQNLTTAVKTHDDLARLCSVLNRDFFAGCRVDSSRHIGRTHRAAIVAGDFRSDRYLVLASCREACCSCAHRKSDRFDCARYPEALRSCRAAVPALLISCAVVMLGPQISTRSQNNRCPWSRACRFRTILERSVPDPPTGHPHHFLSTAAATANFALATPVPGKKTGSSSLSHKERVDSGSTRSGSRRSAIHVLSPP